MASNNKFERLVEETVVEVAPVIAVAARAIGGAGRAIARGIVGAAPTTASRSGAARQTSKKISNIKKSTKTSSSSGPMQNGDWLDSRTRDMNATMARQTRQNNRGTGGSNVVTSGNKTTNHTSN